MKITGTVWKFGQDNINSEQIRKKAYSPLPATEQGRHCLEDLNPEFPAKAKPGDIVVAGKNFGCGSSSPAFNAVIALGIAAVIAESFGRLFYRNSIGAGLMVSACPGIVEFVNDGDSIEIDTVQGQVLNLKTQRVLSFPPLPSFYREMAELGGEKPYLMARLGITNATPQSAHTTTDNA